MSTSELLDHDYLAFAERLIKPAEGNRTKFGHVVIIAGGIGSGKVFVTDGQVGIENYTFEIDALKLMATRTMVIGKKVKDELDRDIEKLSVTPNNLESLSKLHQIVSGHLGLDDERLLALYTTVILSAPDRKPNLILDVTLQDLRQLDNLSRAVRTLGYANDHIHLVWVVNDIKAARRSIATSGALQPEILNNALRGVAYTMHDISSMGKEVRKYMDGDIFFAFKDVESNEVDAFCFKRSGSDPMPFAEIDKDVRRRIASFVPKGAFWE